MKKLSISLLLLLPLVAQAQILNTERFRLDKDTARIWMGTAEFGLSAKRQQTNVFTFKSKGNVAYLSEKHSYMFLGYANLVKVANSNVISEGYGHLRFNFLRRKLFSIEQFNQWQFDQGRGMNSRILSGANVRYRVKSTDKWEFGMNTGLMYETEEWENDFGEMVPNENIKSSTSVSLRYKVSKNFSYIMISYYQARFDDFFNPRVTLDASMQLAINQHLSLRGQFVGMYDAIPVIEINNLIFSVNNTLVFKF